MLPRILEPEVMDSDEDAHEYDAMDHAVVNERFVTDLMKALTDWSLQQPVPRGDSLPILDLGAGTAQIPIEIAHRAINAHITAVDAAMSMMALAGRNIARAGFTKRIELLVADAKHLPFETASFPVVISNSIVHHIPEPRGVIAEAVRVTAAGGLLFHRDLARPDKEQKVLELVDTYAAGATHYQRKLFADSLHAALALEEMRDLVADFGFARETVQLTSDRHWTWSATKK